MSLTPSQLEVLEKYKREQSLHPDPIVVPEIIRNLTEHYERLNNPQEEEEEESGHQFDLTASYEEYNDAMSDDNLEELFKAFSELEQKQAYPYVYLLNVKPPQQPRKKVDKQRISRGRKNRVFKLLTEIKNA